MFRWKVMVRFWVLIMGFTLIPAGLTAQPPDIRWMRNYGGWSSDVGFSVEETWDEGYVIAGYTSSFGEGSRAVYLIRTDPNGDTLWTKTYGGPDWDRGFALKQTSDGGYIIVGSTLSFGEGLYDVYLIRTDPNGDTLWTKTYGGSNSDAGYSIEQTSDGGFIIVGSTCSFGEGSYDVYLIRTDPNGDTLWTKTYGGSNSDAGYSIEQTSDGGFIIAGETWSFGGGDSDVYIIRTTQNGDTLWTKTYGGSNPDAGYSVKQTSDGGFIIVGSTLSFGEGTCDVYLIRTDPNGDTLWTSTYGGFFPEGGYSVKQTSDGGYIIVGGTWSFGAGDLDVYLVRTDPNGDTLWTETYGGSNSDAGYSVKQTSDGGYIAVGYTLSFGVENEDIFLIRTEPEISVEERIPLPQGKDFHLIGIFPTVVKERVRVRFSSPQRGKLRWILYDLSGRRWMEGETRVEESGLQDMVLPLRNLRRGIYFLKVEMNGKVGGCLPLLYVGG